MNRGCRICKGQPRRGTRCMFCGLKLESVTKTERRKTVEEAAADEREIFRQKCFEDELTYLKRTREKMIRFNMVTSGSEDLDKTIIQYLGDWLDPAGREAVQIVCAALKMQVEAGTAPTKARTLEIACAAGQLRSNRQSIYRAVYSHQYAEDDKAREELANRR